MFRGEQSRLMAGEVRTDGTLSDVCLTRLVWLIEIGGFRSRGNFPSVPRVPACYSTEEINTSKITSLGRRSEPALNMQYDSRFQH